VTIEFKDDKFRELMLYVASQMEDDPAFGATVLNKVLFFSDFLAYRFWGQPITGAVYQKLEYGPAPRRLLPEQEHLIAEQRAVMQVKDRGGYTQRRLVVLDKPNLDIFTAEEISLVDRVIAMLRGRGAWQASEISHGVSVGWHAAELREEIRYGTVFLTPPKNPTPSQEVRAKELDAAYATAG